jgi:hypothetical protein
MQSHEFVSETGTFVTITLPNSDKHTRYRKITLPDDTGFYGGGMVECAFKDTKEVRDLFAIHRIDGVHKAHDKAPFNGLLIKAPAVAPDATYRQINFVETRFLPTKMVWVGVEASVDALSGLFHPICKMVFSQVRTARTPEYMPVRSWDNYDYDRVCRAVRFPSRINIANAGVNDGVFLFADGRVKTDKNNDDDVREFVSGCPVEHVLHTIIGKEYVFDGKVYNHHIHKIVPLGTANIRLSEMRTTEHMMEVYAGEAMNDLRAQRHALREELAQYVFNPVRMTRLHGDDALDIMADCY